MCVRVVETLTLTKQHILHMHLTFSFLFISTLSTDTFGFIILCFILVVLAGCMLSEIAVILSDSVPVSALHYLSILCCTLSIYFLLTS